MAQTVNVNVFDVVVTNTTNRVISVRAAPDKTAFTGGNGVYKEGISLSSTSGGGSTHMQNTTMNSKWMNKSIDPWQDGFVRIGPNKTRKFAINGVIAFISCMDESNGNLVINNWNTRERKFHVYYDQQTKELEFESINSIIEGKNDDISINAKPAIDTRGYNYCCIIPSNYLNHKVRHQGYRAKIHSSDGSKLFKTDSTWQIVQGLHNIHNNNNNNGKIISIRSSDKYSNFYLRHRNFELWIDKEDDSLLFKKDSSFYQIEALNGKKGFVSFQSVNYPEYYIRHCHYLLRIDKSNNTQLFKDDASWKIEY